MNRFFGEKQRVTTMKTKAQVCYYDNLQYLHLRLVCDLSNELNTNDDKFTHKMILLSYRKKTWISCYCKKALNSLSLKNE